jgi:hypothetical protein
MKNRIRVSCHYGNRKTLGHKVNHCGVHWKHHGANPKWVETHPKLFTETMAQIRSAPTTYEASPKRWLVT